MDQNEKQDLEEMAKDVARSISWCNEEIPCVDCLGTAASLYAKGYIKQREGEWKQTTEPLGAHDVDWHREAELNAQRIIELEAELAKEKKCCDDLAVELSDLIVEKDKMFDEIESLRDTNEHLAVMLVEARQDVAKWMIDEFLNAMRDTHEKNRLKYGGALALLLPDIEQIAKELKKKYTEDKT